ncbi:MAG: M15 family metallopeptidase [Treponema sp.]|nr:M15 family metallopeptidase [Treponema sp.]
MQRPSISEELFLEPAPVASTLFILDNLYAQEEILLAFARAYPSKISGVEFINDDWSMLVNGERFYFAMGRFLPEERREYWEDFYPYDFYVYPWDGTPMQRQAAFRYPVYSIGSSFLFDTLYFSPDEDASWDLQEKYSFLGVKMLIHPYIKPLLDRVTERILIAAQSDPSIDEWINELRTTPPSFGWNWRTIAHTSRRSNHSYGTGIDLLPRSLMGLYTYWQWGTTDTVSRETHYVPPDAVIEAFHHYGFVWGGHWDLIDTMHFEYRPEILLLNNFDDIFIPES